MPQKNSSRSSDAGRWPILALVLLAVCSAAIYLVVATLAPRFAYIPAGKEHLYQQRPVLPVLGLFAGAFLLYFAGIAVVKRAGQSSAMLVTVLLAAVLFRVILVPSTPILEIDIYRYIWDGAVAARGISPFKYSPQQVLTADRSDELPADLRRLAELRDDPRRIGLRTALSRIHFGHVPTVYPLVSQVVFAAADFISPPDASLATRLTILKAMFVGFELGTIACVVLMLRHLRLPMQWVLVYAWCPLLIKETANGGHLDTIAVCLTALAALLLLYACFPREGKPAGKWRNVLLASLSAAVLSLAIGAKIYPLILAPIFIAACIRTLRIRTVIPAITGVVISIAVLLPMAPRQLAGDTTGGGTDPSQGLRAFIGSWEMNDFLFLLVHENLRADEHTPPGQKAWFNVTPAGFRSGLAQRWQDVTGTRPKNPAFQMARVITCAFFLALASGFAWRGAAETSAAGWLKWVFLTVAWFWLLSPTQNPWYWTWALPFLLFARSRMWLLLAGLSMVYYLRFWLEYHFWDQEVWGTGYTGAPFFDLVVTWLEYAPWLLLLIISWAMFYYRKYTEDPIYSHVMVVHTRED